MERFFHVQKLGTSMKQEVLAGFTTFITVMYIIMTNASILKDAGMPENAAILSTIMVSAVSTIIMGFWSNSPLILVPGMGVNALFTYTLVHGYGVSWQGALAALFISGVLFTLLTFTKLTKILMKSIPVILKQAITVGIGIFILFIGLQKSGIVISNQSTMIGIGDLVSPKVIVALFTLLVIVLLHIWKVPGGLLISLLCGTIVAVIVGETSLTNFSANQIHFSEWIGVLMQMDFSNIGSLVFWMAVFSISIVVIFENMGLIYGQAEMLHRPEVFTPAFRSSGVSNVLAGAFGCSPTVSAVECVSGVVAGGKTGLTAITTGILFLMSYFLIPFMKFIPDAAISAILMFIGVLMIQTIQEIDLSNFTESFPAIVIITFIPLTSSIVDGIAFGFILYPLIKLASKQRQDVAPIMYVLAGLFLVNFFVAFH